VTPLLVTSRVYAGYVQVLWWDVRKLQEPVEVFCLDAQKKQDCTRTTGAMCLEYEPTMVRTSRCDYFCFYVYVHCTSTTQLILSLHGIGYMVYKFDCLFFSQFAGP